MINIKSNIVIIPVFVLIMIGCEVNKIKEINISNLNNVLSVSLIENTIDKEIANYEDEFSSDIIPADNIKIKSKSNKSEQNKTVLINKKKWTKFLFSTFLQMKINIPYPENWLYSITKNTFIITNNNSTITIFFQEKIKYQKLNDITSNLLQKIFKIKNAYIIEDENFLTIGDFAAREINLSNSDHLPESLTVIDAQNFIFSVYFVSKTENSFVEDVWIYDQIRKTISEIK